MSDYKETPLSGTAWQRCFQIVIENPRNGAPVVRFDEESVLAVAGGNEIRQPVGTLTIPFDPAKPMPLRNPGTGELIPSSEATYGEAYVLLYSAYMAAALERDTPPTTQPIFLEGI